MSYSVELFRQEGYKPTFWSGGMATELITYPSNSDYASQNFLWRLGIAKIDIPESTFSNLPNIFRKFMVIEGEITLNHKNRYTKLIKPFEQDSFMGDWNTKTYGKAEVFNLMTRENYSGELIHLSILPKKQIKFKYTPPLNKDLIAICFYAANGNLKSNIHHKIYKINRHDLLLIHNIDLNSINEIIFSNNCFEISNIIVSVIFRK